jgi:predicted dehydrogenase
VVDIALIGAGGIARRHTEALAAIEEAHIAAVVDVAQERAQQLAATCGACAYETMEACLPHVDVAYILTPPSTHRELAMQAIQAGVHVVVEKPLASQIGDAKAMVKAAQQANVKLMVAFNMRFRRGFIRLKEALQSGCLGQPIHFWSQRLGIGVGSGPNWRTTPGLLCGMSVESLSHDIDLLRWLMGEVVDVRANAFESRPDLPGFDDNANVVFTLAHGGTALIHASWSSHLGRNSRGVIGTRGTAMVAGSGLWNLDDFHLKTLDMEYERIDVLNDKLDVHSYRDESRHFIDCVQNDRQPMVTGEDGLAALRISHAILTSHHERRVVTLEA